MNALKFYFKFLVLISLFLSYPAIAAQWTWRNPLPQGNPLNSVSCPTENLCVAVGDYGTVLTSTKGGTHWTLQSSGTSKWLYDISCPTENLCVAVGGYGTVLTSTDGGINWIGQSTGTSNRLNGISCPTTNLCVAVGDYGTVLTSTEGGVNWTVQSTGTSNNLWGISCPTETLCMVVGDYGTVLTSTNGGVNWTVQAAGASNNLFGISCRNNRCIVVGEWGSILTTDNITCEPAIYSNQTAQAYLPAVEISLFNTISLYSASLESAGLEMAFGFYDFEVKNLTFIQTIATSDPCHAIFTPDTGILTIPILQVTEEPLLTCSATLQQSVLQPEVLRLIEYACDLPL